MPQQNKKPIPQIDPFEQALERKNKMSVADKKSEQSHFNFTKLPENLLESLLTNAANFTPLNIEHLKKNDDAAKEAQDHKDLIAVRRRLQQLRGEEEEARQYFKEKDMVKKREEEEEQKQREQEEAQRQQAEMAGDEPGSKQARGSLFGKKKKKSLPQKTIENKAGQSKH